MDSGYLLEPLTEAVQTSTSNLCFKQKYTVKFLDFQTQETSLKIQTKRPNLKVFCQKHANGIANSEDPDQTAPLGAV